MSASFRIPFKNNMLHNAVKYFFHLIELVKSLSTNFANSSRNLLDSSGTIYFGLNLLGSTSVITLFCNGISMNGVSGNTVVIKSFNEIGSIANANLLLIRPFFRLLFIVFTNPIGTITSFLAGVFPSRSLP